MGDDSPELETPDVVKAKAERADVQLLARGAMLDDPEPNAALAGSNGPVEDEEELVGICQICMDVVPRAQVVERVCGSQDCEGEVCAACLVQHAIATVYAFYAGVLPKVRCPMCLAPLNKRQWARFVLPEEPVGVVEASGNEPVAEEEIQESELVAAETETPEEGSTASDDAESSDSDSESEAGVQEEEEEEEWVDDNSHVLDKYVMLCRQSCGFQSPCCHNTEYTMLPGAARRAEADALVLALTPEQEAGLPEFLAALRAFCFHKEDTDAVYEKLQSVFGDEAEDVMWELLPRITDEERRAALLLHHLFVHPNTETRCCGEQVCFKCKASDHHDGNCNDFIEEESVLECRGCHVTLVKVEGCDTVACLCGYSFSWQEEVDRRRRQRCQLAPSCDREYVQWQRWHRLATRNFPKIENLDDTLRKARLAKLLRAHRPLLQRVIMARVERKRQQQLKHLNDVGEGSVANAAAA